MGGITDSNAVDSADNTLTVITDGETTSGVKAGVTSANRLKVDALVTAIGGSAVPSYSCKLRLLDMNVVNGGVARGTSVTNAAWVTVFNYSGSGLLSAFIVNLETKEDWLIRLVVDSDEIFGASGILTGDMHGDNLYDLEVSGSTDNNVGDGVGVYIGEHDVFHFQGPLHIPIKYTANVQVLVKRNTGAGAKKFLAGLMTLTKDT
jgi:hypothetical protein